MFQLEKGIVSVCAEMIVMEEPLCMRGAQEPALVRLVLLLQVHMNYSSVLHIVYCAHGLYNILNLSLQGQLGRGKSLGSCTPLKVPMGGLLRSDERIVEIACGANHSAMVTNMGALITFGAGMHGQRLCYTCFFHEIDFISVWNLKKIYILCACRSDRTWGL